LKRKFSKILGVGVTLALITSLLLVAAPVSALTQPSVTVDPATISAADADYTISFQLVEELIPTDKIVVTFPEGTTVAATPTVTIQGWCTPTLAYRAVDTPIAAGDVDTREVELTWSTDNITSLGTVKVTFLTGITNPDDADDYTLTVATVDSADDEIEAAVTSAAYEVEVPDVGVLPGIVQQYNAVNILMAQDTGDDAINTMVDTAGEGYTIIVGPGEYALAAVIALDQDGLTLKSSAGADDTIIVADAGKDAIQITADEVTFDGFTVQDTEDGYTAIKVTGDDAIVENNILTAEDGYPEGIRITGSGATVSDNELDIYHTMMVLGATDCTLSDNTFDAGINLQGSTGITITDNDIIGSELTGIVFESSVSSDILIEGNTISETTDGVAIGIYFRPSIGTYDEIQIVGNDITDNEGVGVRITTGNTLTNSVIKFNTITGNDADNDGYGIQNDSASDVDASFNWWGTSVADDVADMVNDTSTGETTYEPFLTGVVVTVFSASDVAAGATSLDAKTTVGVKVESVATATTITVARYVANPQAALSDAIAFFDVYVAAGADDDPVTIKFYVGDENTEVYIWSADTEGWAEVDADFSVYGGYVYITVMADMLGRTPFALVAGEAVADELDTPVIAAPVSGDDTVSLTPTFAWGAVDDADGYYFEFADNANFVMPLVKLDGDMGRLLVTAYAYVGDLPYSTAYYWKVKAVSGTIEAGDLVASDWASAVFITKEEPVEPLPPVVIEPTPPAPPAPIITIEQPDIIVPLPTVVETPITPSWIYVIIGVGAVLVIALLVLIVRTRRVA